MTYAIRHITQDDLPGSVDWTHFADALEAGHRMPMAQVEDVFLGPSESSLLSRAAWIEGLGFGVKSVTVMAENATRGLPSIQGAMLVFDNDTGRLSATIDSALVTNIKTAADSVLGARLLARRDSRTHLIVGVDFRRELTRYFHRDLPHPCLCLSGHVVVNAGVSFLVFFAASELALKR